MKAHGNRDRTEEDSRLLDQVKYSCVIRGSYGSTRTSPWEDYGNVWIFMATVPATGERSTLYQVRFFNTIPTPIIRPGLTRYEIVSDVRRELLHERFVVSEKVVTDQFLVRHNEKLIRYNPRKVSRDYLWLAGRLTRMMALTRHQDNLRHDREFLDRVGAALHELLKNFWSALPSGEQFTKAHLREK